MSKNSGGGEKSLLQRIVELFGSPYAFFRWLLVVMIMSFRIRGKTKKMIDKALKKASEEPTFQELDDIERMQFALGVMGNVLQKVKEGRGGDLEEIIEEVVEEEKAVMLAQKRAEAMRAAPAQMPQPREIEVRPEQRPALVRALLKGDPEEVARVMREIGHEYRSHEINGMIARVICSDGECAIVLEPIEPAPEEKTAPFFEPAPTAPATAPKHTEPAPPAPGVRIKAEKGEGRVEERGLAEGGIWETLTVDGKSVSVGVVRSTVPLEEPALRKILKSYAKRQYDRVYDQLKKARLTMVSHERTPEGGRIICKEGEIVLTRRPPIRKEPNH
ncbi:MAG: hypothetical protein QXG08_01135 [Candidatus Methanomethyliaceae archaeon]